MESLKKKNAITLVALVVTIIVLLILAGVTLSFVAGENGILKRATDAVEVNEIATAQEQANLLVADIVTQYYEEKYVEHKETEGLDSYIQKELDKGRETATGDYIVSADINGNVEVTKAEKVITTGKIANGKIEWLEEEIEGVKPEIKAEIVTNGYVLEGNSVQIKITAKIAEGTVEVTELEGMTVESQTEKEKVYRYTVNQNGNYTFTAEGDSGRKATTTIKVNQIINKPRININNNTGTAITLNVENDYPAEANVTYTYYLEKTAKATNITEKSFTIDGLTEETEYTVKVVITLNGTSLESDVIKVSTIGIPTPPKTVMTSLEENPEKTALEYPILTLSGVMNSTVNCKQGDKVRIEIENVEGTMNYYSIDGGENWIKYTNAVEIAYPGDGLLKAKSENGLGSSEIKSIMPYSYDSNINCTGPTTEAKLVLNKEAYDRDYLTYTNCDAPTGKAYYIQVDSECWKKYVTLYTKTEGGFYGVMSCLDSSGSILKNGYIRTLTGEDMNMLTAKSIEIPKETYYIEFHDGTYQTTQFYLYEVWCSEENLNGKTY